MDTGIAQGRVLSPLLFNLLVNSLAAAIRRASPGVRLVPSSVLRLTDQLYADDLVVFGGSEADLQLALDAVTRWGRQWRFSFGVGPEKSAVMIFGPARPRPSCRVCLSGHPLPVVSSYRYLVVVLTPSLRWAAHVAHLVSRGHRLFAPQFCMSLLCRTASALQRADPSPFSAVFTPSHQEDALSSQRQCSPCLNVSQAPGPTGVFPFYVITRQALMELEGWFSSCDPSMAASCGFSCSGPRMGPAPRPRPCHPHGRSFLSSMCSGSLHLQF